MAKYDIGPRIGIEGEAEFRKAIQTINASLRSLDTEMAAAVSQFEKGDTSMEAVTAQSRVLNKQIDEQNKKLELLQKGLASAAEKYGENDRVTKGWQASVNKATAELNKMERELQDLSKIRLEALSKQLDEVGSKMESTGKKMSILSGAIVAGAGVAAKAAIDFESAFAGVEKTVDGTAEQLQEVSDGIRKMALEIPASTTEIAGVAEAAGQLGIKTEDILKFTRVMIDLGETTNLSAEQAAISLAKFANITKMSADDYERLGATIVDLGNNTATTEADITSMATRLASTGELVGLTEAQILGLSATLSSLGIEAEAGGSALAKLLKQFEVMTSTGSKDLKDFAKVAGMSADEFTSSWKKDPTEALAAFIKGLGNLDKSGVSTVATLEKLGISEIRMSNAVLAMASSGDLLARNLEIANNAWAENSALQTEAEKRYKTTESQMQIAKNTLNDIAITMGAEFLPMVNKLIGGIKNLGEWFANLDETGKNNVIRILAIVAAMGPMVALTGKIITGIKGITTAVTAYRTAAAAGATATAALGAAMNATPVGLIATGIALLGSAIIGNLVANALKGADAVSELTGRLDDLKTEYEQTTKTLADNAKAQITNIGAAAELVTKFEALNAKMARTTAEQEELSLYADQINKLLGEQVLIVDNVSGSYNSAVGSIDDYIAALERQITAELLVEQMTAEIEKKIAAKGIIDDATAQIEAYEAELKKLTDVVDALQAQDLAPEPKDIAAISDLQGAIYKTNKALSAAQTEYDAAEAAIADLETQIKEATGSTEDNTAATEENADAQKTARVSTEENAEAIKENIKAARALTGDVDKLNNALKEQAENGQLSTSTILDLVDAGYAAALQIDEETGAVRLNQKAYEDLTQAKIEEQKHTAAISALNAQREMMLAIAEAASLAAKGYYEEAKAQYAVAAAAKDQAIEANANIKALDRLSASVGKYTVSVSTSASTTKTETEKISDAFSDAVKDIERELELGEIDQEQYWTRYSELMSEHLKEGSEEWEDANHKLLLGQKKLNEALEAESRKTYETMSDNLHDIKDEYDKALSDIQGQVDSMADRIAKIELVSKGEEGYQFVDVESLRESNEQIKRLNYNLDQLERWGISDSLLAEIAKMETETANSYAEYLLSLTKSGEWKEYMQEWERRQELALETATNFYKDELEALDREFSGKLIETLESLEEETMTIGQDMASALAEGILSKIGFVENAMSQLRSAASMSDIASNVGPANNSGLDTLIDALGVVNKGTVQINLTTTLDGRQLARGLYEYNIEQGKIEGTNLVMG